MQNSSVVADPPAGGGGRSVAGGQCMDGRHNLEDVQRGGIRAVAQPGGDTELGQIALRAVPKAALAKRSVPEEQNVLTSALQFMQLCPSEGSNT